MKSYYSIKLTRSNLFRQYFIKKNNWEGGLMERYLREVIGNYLTLNSPSPISKFIIYYLLIKLMFGVFTLAIKLDCLFLGKFSLICDFNFGQSSPPLNICFKKCFKSLFVSSRAKKAVSKELKTWHFSDSTFWLTGQWGRL